MDCECDLVGVKRISGGQGKGQDAESAGHIIPRLPFPADNLLSTCLTEEEIKKDLFQ